MDTLLTKADDFVNRLLFNPSINNLHPLQKEEQIFQLFRDNARQLFPTLSSPAFFPGKNWEEIYNLLSRVLLSKINRILIQEISAVLKEQIDCRFLTSITGNAVPVVEYQKEIVNFFKKVLNKIEIRRNLSGTLNAIKMNLADRYIDASYELRKYVYIEMTKVQKLDMSNNEIKNLIKMLLLLRVCPYFLIKDNPDTAKDISYGLIAKNFAGKALTVLRKQFQYIPEVLLKEAINSHLSYLENSEMEATARIIAIFASRGRQYRPISNIDRGADTPDKSWFNIGRRNYKYYGFDIKMLDEFYMIAAENGW